LIAVSDYFTHVNLTLSGEDGVRERIVRHRVLSRPARDCGASAGRTVWWRPGRYARGMTGSYSYAERRGVRDVSWTDFYALCKGLARAVDAFDPEVVVGLARGGLYPAMQIAHLRRAEFLVVRLTRRVRDRVVHDSPVWMVRPDAGLAGRRALIVDEISDSGETLRIARDEVLRVGATAAATCVLYAHARGAAVPDYIGLISDELILNPWDREVLADGRFTVAAEYADACALQGIDPAVPDPHIAAIAPAKP
jgi:hypoxanthine phosphoribosyltransferase